MLNHLKFKQNRHELQVSFHYFYQLCSLLYQRYCPRSVIERRNVEHTKITDLGYNLWTPYRSNMKGAKQHNKRQLKALRRTIESRFSILAQQFGIETNLTRSLFGFQLKIELTILVYNLGFFDFMTN
ncbi:putative transposase-like protein [Ligilactobacillus acidipiscis]|nr:putative transposase-like protein [Ligilactobacillus acidipiscis]